MYVLLAVIPEKYAQQRGCLLIENAPILVDHQYDKILITVFTFSFDLCNMSLPTDVWMILCTKIFMHLTEDFAKWTHLLNVWNLIWCIQLSCPCIRFVDPEFHNTCRNFECCYSSCNVTRIAFTLKQFWTFIVYLQIFTC